MYICIKKKNRLTGNKKKKNIYAILNSEQPRLFIELFDSYQLKFNKI